jgi:DNA-directed RNA polymerase specialized sigma24 family protein
VMLGDAAEAREVTRWALLGTCVRISQLDEASGFMRSAYRLLTDECLHVLRVGPVRLPGAPIAGGDPGGSLEDAAAFRALTFDDRCARGRAAILQLLPESRAIVVLRHLAGLSYEEIAMTLDLPGERVRLRLHAVRQQLGERLLGWPRHSTLSASQDDLLQRHLDGALDADEREARERLLAVHADAPVRAAALRELGHLLNMLAPEEPPIGLTTQVLSWAEFLTTRGSRATSC